MHRIRYVIPHKAVIRHDILSASFCIPTHHSASILWSSSSPCQPAQFFHETAQQEPEETGIRANEIFAELDDGRRTDTRSSPPPPFHITSRGLKAFTTHQISLLKKRGRHKASVSKEELEQILQELSATAKRLECTRSDLLNAIALVSHSFLHRGQFNDVLKMQTLLKQGNVPLTPDLFGQILTASIMTRNVKSARNALKELEEQGEPVASQWYADYVSQIWDDHLYLALYPLKDFLIQYHAGSLHEDHLKAIALACFHVGDKKAASETLNHLSEKLENAGALECLKQTIIFGLNKAKTRLLSQQSTGRTMRFFNGGGLYNALLSLSQDHEADANMWETFLHYLLKSHVVSLPPRQLSQSMPASFGQQGNERTLSMGHIVTTALDLGVNTDGERPRLSPYMLTRLLQMCYTGSNRCSTDDAEAILHRITADQLSWEPHAVVEMENETNFADKTIHSACEIVLRTLVDLSPSVSHVTTFIDKLTAKQMFPRSQKLHRDTVNCIQHSGADVSLEGLTAYSAYFLDDFVETSLQNLLHQEQEEPSLGFLKTFGERVKLIARAYMRMNDTENLNIIMAKGIENYGRILTFFCDQFSLEGNSKYQEAVWDTLLEILHAYAAYGEFLDGRGPYAYIHQKEGKDIELIRPDMKRGDKDRNVIPFNHQYPANSELCKLLYPPERVWESRENTMECLLKMARKCRLDRFMETTAGKLEISKAVVTSSDASALPRFLSVSSGKPFERNKLLTDGNVLALVDVMKEASHSKTSVYVTRRISLFLLENHSELPGSVRKQVMDDITSVIQRVVREFSMESQKRVDQHLRQSSQPPQKRRQ